MTISNSAEEYTYDDLHAVVVDALRYDISGKEALDHAADEVLVRLRGTGLDIPAGSSGTGPEAAY